MYREEIHRRAALAAEAIVSIAGMTSQRAAGGFYTTLKLAESMDEDFLTLKLLEKERLLMHPGYFYDVEGRHVILSHVGEPKMMHNALEKIGGIYCNSISVTSGRRHPSRRVYRPQSDQCCFGRRLELYTCLFYACRRSRINLRCVGCTCRAREVGNLHRAIHKTDISRWKSRFFPSGPVTKNETSPGKRLWFTSIREV